MMNRKRWELKSKEKEKSHPTTVEDLMEIVLKNRGIITPQEKNEFLHPIDPYSFSPTFVGIDDDALGIAGERIEKAIHDKESIVVYADYDADGVTAGSVLWETLYALGARVMPYIPSRVDEGYGLSTMGIDSVKKEFSTNLIITVDHGITGREKVAYARNLGIDVIVTDHHTKPDILPESLIVHTTQISGAGVSWFVAKTLLEHNKKLLSKPIDTGDLLALTAIGTIADLMPLIGPNRSIAYYGLIAMNKTKRVGLLAMMKEAGLTQGNLGVYDISHVLSPRLNAMGRLEHAMDALRLLCTTNEEKALSLSSRLGMVNKERQQLTMDTSIHAKDLVAGSDAHHSQRILIVADEMYNPGIIGLVAGRLVEEYYLPSIVLAKGETISKASARSIAGFNIVDAIRKNCQDLLIDVGGHPMAAGFTIETKKLPEFIQRMEAYAAETISDDQLIRSLGIDAELSLPFVSYDVYHGIQTLAPFGMGNPEPVFMSENVRLLESRLIGKDGKHLKLRFLPDGGIPLDAVAFGMGELYGTLQGKDRVNVAYTIDNNIWNGSEKLQLKVRDIVVA